MKRFSWPEVFEVYPVIVGLGREATGITLFKVLTDHFNGSLLELWYVERCEWSFDILWAHRLWWKVQDWCEQKRTDRSSNSTD